MKMIGWASIFILFTFSTSVLSQHKKIIFQQLDTDNGLSSDLVGNVVQDHDGFIWIATIGGLNRFDGKTIKKYYHFPENRNSISSNVIRHLTMDKNGTLWIGSDMGLSKYIPEIDQFKNYNTDTKGCVIRKEMTGTIALDKNKNLWAYQQLSQKLYLFDTKNERVKIEILQQLKSNFDFEGPVIDLKLLDSKNRMWFTSGAELLAVGYDGDSSFIAWRFSENIRDGIEYKSFPGKVFEDSEGNIYISNHGLFQFNELDGSFSYIDIFPYTLPRSDIDFVIQSIDEDQDGNLWIGTQNHNLIQFNKKERSVNYPLTLRNERKVPVLRVKADKQGNIWAFTNNDVLFFKEKDADNFNELRSTPDENTRLPEYAAIADAFKEQLFVDQSGVHWFNTANNGIVFFNLHELPFRLIQANGDGSNTIRKNSVWGICEDHKGRIWMGTDGLNMYDPRENKMHWFNKQSDPGLKYLIDKVPAIIEVFPDQFFVSTSGRVIWYQYHSGELKMIRNFFPDENNNNSIAKWSPFSFFKDSKDNIWMGNIGGFSRYQLPSDKWPDGKFTNYMYENDTSMFPKDIVWSFYEDHKGRIWILSDKLLCYSPESEVFIREIPVFEHDTITDVDAMAMVEQPENVYWIATEKAGFIKFVENTHRFERVKMDQNVIADKFYSVFFGSDNKFWLSSNKGIVVYDTITNEASLFTKNDGLQGNEFVAGAFHRGKKSGNIYMAGNNGLNYFHPDSIHISDYEPGIAFTGLRVLNHQIDVGTRLNGRPVLTKNINYTKKVVLHYDENAFSIEFAALHFKNIEKIKYKTFLEGIDKEWHLLTNNKSTVQYAGLPPGEYTFNVKASNSDGVWFDNTRELEIVILAPWWRSWWAYILYSMVMVVLIYLFRRIILLKASYNKQIEIAQLKFEQQRQMLEKEKEVEQIKSRFFMNISHEFRTPLTLIIDPINNIIRSEKVTGQVRQNLSLIRKNADRLNRLVSQLLDLRRLETGNMKLNLKRGNLLNLIQNIFESFDPLAELHHISYNFKFEQTGDTVSDENRNRVFNVCFDEDKIEKILYNILSNAFKYTPNGGEISLELNVQQDMLKIAISDTGTGISQEHLDRIFDRFYRIEDKGLKAKTGAGIGLALTKELVEIHHGTIDVLSRKDEGTRFTVYLPLLESAYSKDELPLEDVDANHEMKTEMFKTQLQGAETNIAYSAPRNKELPLVLIVDDEKDILDYLWSCLRENYNVLLANNGSAGFEMAVREIPDLIVSDVMMPGMDGMELCHRLKSNMLTSHIPVILLTALINQENQKEGLSQGADDYIAKPFDVNILQLKLKNILETRSNLLSKIRNEFFSDRPKVNNETDDSFIKQVADCIIENLSKESYSIDDLAIDVNISRRQLYRKLSGITGISVQQFMTNIKLKKSFEMLRSGKYNVTEVAALTGFKTHSNFTKSFKQLYNKLPSDLIPR